MPIRGPAFSKTEENFLLKAVTDGIRIDQRDMLEYREVRISFGIDYGCCTVDMGSTKVMAQVTSELERPRESRPSEGRLNVHVEMSTIAYPTFDPTKPGELGVSIQRMLERSLKMSRAVDLEELCIRVGEKSWTIHLHIHVLSHDGNIMDCAFIAAISALKHFKRPDVSVVGQEIFVHTMEEKNPIPLTLHHMPLCVSFVFFKGCERMALDPTLLEEKVMDGKMMLSMNKHNEVCSLQMSGQMNITKEQILHCTTVAASKVKMLTSLITQAIDTDTTDKKSGKTKSSTVKKDERKKDKEMINVNVKESQEITLEKLTVEDDDAETKNGIQVTDEKPYWLTKHSNQTVSIGEGQVNSWIDNASGGGVIKDLRKSSASEEDSGSGSEDEVVVMEGDAF